MRLPKDELELKKWLAGAFMSGFAAGNGCATPDKIAVPFHNFYKALERTVKSEDKKREATKPL